MTGDLAAWLLADDGPIAEDERVAREATYAIAYFDPARTLAECAAKRKIVENLADYADPAVFGEILAGLVRDTLLVLAQVYAGRPGWRDEWTLD